MCAFNMAFQAGWFLFFNRFMINRSVQLFSFFRVAFAYVVFHLLHEEVFIKNHFAQNVRVNVNDMFDQDEKFLYANSHFKAMIKKMCDNHATLINSNFDLSSITNDNGIAKVEKTINTADDKKVEKPYNSSEL